jgi:conjugative relaxase-like TrwC/TraI family protein
MLGVHRLTSAEADYYLTDMARELPLPSRWDDRAAQWEGTAAEGLGLRGAPDPRALGAVLDGRHPVAGHRLRSDRATVRGFDLTFSAPKSVSVVFALGGSEVARHVVSAHREGVRGALAYVETHGLSAQRGSGEEREVVPTTGLVAASFTHGVSRNLDPHLHTHVVMANMVHGLDGRWSACDHRGLAAHRAAASAIYEAHLRGELTARLGVRWAEAPRLGFEVAGVSPLALGEFSSRSADIRRHMSERGSHSARGAHIAWAATRPEKGAGLEFAELSSRWKRQGRAVGCDRSEISALLGRADLRDPQALNEHRFVNEHRFGAALSLSPDGAARRRDIAVAFSTAALAGAHAQSVERLTDLWTPDASARAQIGVAEDIRTLRSLVPGGHLFEALGPRPVDPADHEVWRDAARVIDGYRGRWNVGQGSDVLGTDRLTSGISSLPTARLVDHLQTTRHMEAARQRLGWRAPLGHEMGRGR